MHSHSRTLISRLGFADPDKKDRRHDLACQYLATEDAVWGVVNEAAIFAGLLAGRNRYSWRCHDFGDSSIRLEVHKRWPVVLEHPLVKRTKDQQPSSVVGFLDAMIPLVIRIGEDGKVMPKGSPAASRPDIMGRIAGMVEGVPNAPQLPPETWYVARAVVEVKVNPVGIGDILRQMKFYREYSSLLGLTFAWVVATTYPLGRLDVATLNREGFVHHHLGEDFEEWVDFQDMDQDEGDTNLGTED